MSLQPVVACISTVVLLQRLGKLVHWHMQNPQAFYMSFLHVEGHGLCHQSICCMLSSLFKC